MVRRSQAVRAMADPAVAELTSQYERWLGDQITVVEDDLRRKHAEMSSSELRFLRGTYYLWLSRLAVLLPETLDGPEVSIIGDLHVENFGTWTDHRGVRRWGVNDFDELSWGGYQTDLIRLATSAALTPHIPLSDKAICRILLEEWHAHPPTSAVDLANPAARHLRSLVPVPKSAKKFYAALSGSPVVDEQVVPASVRLATRRSAPGEWSPSWHARTAGTGSLGHQRFVAVGTAAAGRTPQARDLKQLGPPTADWVRTELAIEAALPVTERLPIADDLLFGRTMAALRGPDPMRRVNGWQIRRLAPDVVRIELAGLPPRDAERLLRSMARAVADVHGVDRARLRYAQADNKKRGAGWLRDAVAVMAADTRTCYAAWSGGQSAALGE
jgi:hypothetical protein